MSTSTGGTFQTIAGYLGNVMEWYDFAIYGFFSDTIAEIFFPPSNDGHDNLVMSYVVFGLAFLMRPLGGLVTGHIGDKFGRKRAVVFSLLTMSIPTVAMGCLPTYAQVGSWSTALLVTCRLLQGFSVGGQLPSSVVYSLEAKPREHWGFYGGLIIFSMGIGSIVGNLVGALIRSLLTDAQLVSWGWRVGFFTGVLFAPVPIFLHFYGAEVNPNEGEFDTHDENVDNNGQEENIISRTPTNLQQSSPLKEAFRKENRTSLLTSFLTPMLGGAGHVMTFVWMAIYMSSLINPPVKGAFWVNLLAAITGHNMTAIGTGWLSDLCGRGKIMLTGAVSVGLLAPVFLWIISRGKTLDAFFAQWTLGVLLSLFTGPLMAWIPERFPPKVRLTSAALGYNLGTSLSAGFAPAIATALSRDFGPVAPAVIYPIFAILALIGMFVSTKIPHQEEGKRNVLLREEIPTQLEPDSLSDSTTPLVLA